MSNLLTAETKRVLEPALEGTTLIIAIGNTLRHDDGVGPYIANQLTTNLPCRQAGNQQLTTLRILNVGQNPENAIDEAVKINPSKTIIIDASDFGGVGGEARVVLSDQIPETTMSTHTFPLKIIAKMIEADTGSKVYFLGIQSERMDLGEGLSPSVLKTAKEVVGFYA